MRTGEHILVKGGVGFMGSQVTFARLFVHLHDVANGYLAALTTALDEKFRNQILDPGSKRGNYSKDRIVNLVLQGNPEVMVRNKDLSFGRDRRYCNAEILIH